MKHLKRQAYEAEDNQTRLLFLDSIYHAYSAYRYDSAYALSLIHICMKEAHIITIPATDSHKDIESLMMVWKGLQAVSYTHLDVYKRQPFRYPHPSWNA